MKREPRAAPGSGERLLEVAGVRAGYAGTSVLAGVSLHVDRGEIVAVVGANGAGKTTLIRTLAGMLRASAGTVRFDGIGIAGLSSNAVCEAGLAQVPEGRQLFPTLSVEDNLRLGGNLQRARRRTARNLERVFELFPRLSERRSQLAGTLSGGEQQMVAIGRAIMAEPVMIMLDEPSLGLSPLLVGQMFDIVSTLNRDGMSILLVEQNVAESLEHADRAYVLENGEVVLEGSGGELLGNDDVRRAYLGL
ncbi:MAG: ABC transporter ATP-binding protein [Burkholderiaceae bacterium]|nr:ABC transporter ATP-binding protein [Burkholderiaceae bacterium]